MSSFNVKIKSIWSQKNVEKVEELGFEWANKQFQKKVKSLLEKCVFSCLSTFFTTSFLIYTRNVADVIFMVLRYMLAYISVNFW